MIIQPFWKARDLEYYISWKVRVPKLEKCCVSFYLFSFSIFFLSVSLLSLSLSPCPCLRVMLCCVDAVVVVVVCVRCGGGGVGGEEGREEGEGKRQIGPPGCWFPPKFHLRITDT